MAGNAKLTIVDRRRRTRRRTDLPQPVKISHAGPSGSARTFVAKLVDAGEDGLGVESMAPLSQGTTVHLSADLSNDDFALALTGPARVVHARETEPGHYRMGLSLEEVTYRRLAIHDAHEPVPAT